MKLTYKLNSYNRISLFYNRRTVKAYDNLGRSVNTGVELTFDQKMTQNWRMSGSLNLYQNKIFAHSGTIQFPRPQVYTIEKQTDAPVFAKINNHIKLPWNIQMELSGIYFSEKNTGQGKELSRGGVDLGFKKTFPNNRLEVALTANDMFNTMGIRQDIRGNGFRVEYRNHYETQIVTIGIKYKF